MVALHLNELSVEREILASATVVQCPWTNSLKKAKNCKATVFNKEDKNGTVNSQYSLFSCSTNGASANGSIARTRTARSSNV
ncbi:hypothetical protein Q6247_26045, partial [Klebsiella pneumoniae]